MATVWKEPIFDRTSQDVETAIQKIAAWKKHHTHIVDIKVENNALILVHNGTAYATDNTLVTQAEGAVFVDDNVMILDIDDVYDLKGCLNLADLNRIEGNIAYLAEMLEEYGYSPNIHGKQWEKDGVPTQNDMERIVGNIRDIISVYYSPINPPTLPTTMLSYSDINAIEENLYLIKEILDWMKKSFKAVGTIKCGATTILPIRR